MNDVPPGCCCANPTRELTPGQLTARQDEPAETRLEGTRTRDVDHVHGQIGRGLVPGAEILASRDTSDFDTVSNQPVEHRGATSAGRAPFECRGLREHDD